MTDQNIAQSLRQGAQDLIAPELREVKANLANLEKTIDIRFAAVEKSMAEDRAVRDAQFKAVDARFISIDARFNGFEKSMAEDRAVRDAQFKAVDARFSGFEKSMAEDRAVRDAQFKAMMATMDANATRQVSELDRRVTILETLYQQNRHDSPPRLA